MTTPERIGRFRIQRMLGKGGMGVVYEGYDEPQDRYADASEMAAALAAVQVVLGKPESFEVYCRSSLPKRFHGHPANR